MANFILSLGALEQAVLFSDDGGEHQAMRLVEIADPDDHDTQSPVAAGNILQVAGVNGQLVPVTISGAGGVTGTGTTGKITKWSSSTGLTDSVITEASGNISLGGDLTLPTGDMHIIAGDLAIGIATALSIIHARRSGGAAILSLERLDNTVVTDDLIASVTCNGGEGAAAASIVGQAKWIAEADWSETSSPNYYTISTTEVGNVTDTEWFRITSAGLVKLLGGLSTAIVAKTANYPATVADHTILCDASGGAFTITLPAVSGLSGLIYNIKKTDSSANVVTIDGNGSETIDGQTTQAVPVQYDCITLQSDGTEWWIL